MPELNGLEAVVEKVEDLNKLGKPQVREKASDEALNDDPIDLVLEAKPKADDEAIDIAPLNIGDSLNKIKNNQEQIDRIRMSLLQIITVISDNPSLFSKVSKSYGEMHITAKIGTSAVILISPALAAFLTSGGAAMIGIGLTFSAINGLGMYLLDDHSKCTINTTENLEKGVNAIVDLLAAVIGELNAVSAKLEKGVDNLNKEVVRLNSAVDGLNIVVDTLHSEVGSLKLELGRLNTEIDRLSAVSNAFEIREQELLKINHAFEIREQELLQINDDLNITADKFQNSAIKHETLYDELLVVKNDISKELKKLQAEIAMRDQALFGLFKSQGKEQREINEKKIERYLMGARADYSELTKTFNSSTSELTEKLTQSTNELKESEKMRVILQNQLEESIIKLSQTEIRYDRKLADLEALIEELRAHHHEVKNGSQAQSRSAMQTFDAGVKEQPVSAANLLSKNSWLSYLGSGTQREVPIATVVDEKTLLNCK